jgi:hypothetical protein
MAEGVTHSTIVSNVDDVEELIFLERYDETKRMKECNGAYFLLS